MLVINSGNGKFQEFASVPTALLKLGTIWELDMPEDGAFRQLYNVFRFLNRYVFIAAAIVFRLYYAMYCRNMAVSIKYALIVKRISFALNLLKKKQKRQEFIACMCMTTTCINVTFRVSTLIRKIDSVYAFSDGLNAAEFIPRDADEEK